MSRGRPSYSLDPHTPRGHCNPIDRRVCLELLFSVLEIRPVLIIADPAAGVATRDGQAFPITLFATLSRQAVSDLAIQESSQEAWTFPPHASGSFLMYCGAPSATGEPKYGVWLRRQVGPWDSTIPVNKYPSPTIQHPMPCPVPTPEPVHSLRGLDCVKSTFQLQSSFFLKSQCP
jgi:hypothetical protein